MKEQRYGQDNRKNGKCTQCGDDLKDGNCPNFRNTNQSKRDDEAGRKIPKILSTPAIVIISFFTFFLFMLPGIALAIIRYVKFKDKKSCRLLVVTIIIPIATIFLIAFTSGRKYSKVENLIDKGEYIQAQKEIVEGSFSNDEKEKLYYKLFIAQGKYDEAAERLIRTYQNYSNLSEVPDTVIEKLDAIYDNLSQENKKKVDDLNEKIKAIKLEEEQKKDKEEQAKKEKEAEEAQKAAEKEKEAEEAQKAAEKEKEAEEAQKVAEKEKTDREKKAEDNSKKENEIKDWIEENYQSGSNISAKEIKKVTKKIDEVAFCKIWMKSLGEKIEDTQIYSSMNTRLVKDYSNLYITVWNTDSSINEISSIEKEIENYCNDAENIQKKYGFSLEAAYLQNADFYITQRLNTSYSDNILGKIQKEIDSYTPENTSDWVAYNVDYSFGTATPGDVRFVIHADYLNPFSKQGAYNIDFVETNETVELVDSKGFRETIAVYQLIDEPDQFNQDMKEYCSAIENRDAKSADLVDIIKQ